MKKLNILFVCSGNTCRSPIAKAIFQKMIVEDDRLRGWVNVDSAGIFAIDGSPASNMAKEVVREFGASLDTHRAKSINDELVEWADLILCMEPDHIAFLLEDYEDILDKVYLLTEYVDVEGYVPDPYGEDIHEYRETARLIYGLLTKLKNKIAGPE